MATAVTIPKSIKLLYFDAPGRGEATRLMLKLNKIPFEDVTFGWDEWPKLKPSMPFGRVPVLEVDGQQLAQTAAIERYVAKLTGMYPDDPWQAAKGEELICFCAECFELFNSAQAIKDPEQQAEARRAIVDGPLQAKLAKLNEVLGALGPDTYVAGSKDVTCMDISLFSMLSFLSSGFFLGIPKDLLQPFPGLVAYHDRIARLPGIQAVYEGVMEGPRLAFKVGGVGAA